MRSPMPYEHAISSTALLAGTLKNGSRYGSLVTPWPARHARHRESHADPPPFASSVSQDVWWGDSASEGHLPAAVNGWQLSESVGWIMPRAQGVVS